MIKAQNVIKSFEGRTILKDITAEFGTGQTNLIIGRSGSGKTVLLKSLVGLHDVDSGEIWYDDVCYSKLDFKARKEACEPRKCSPPLPLGVEWRYGQACRHSACDSDESKVSVLRRAQLGTRPADLDCD